MKALTVRDPWAWAIEWQVKPIENRSRGAQRWAPTQDVALHVGHAWSHRGAMDERLREAWGRLHGFELVGKLRQDVRRSGVIVAVFDIVDVHPDAKCCDPWGEHRYHAADGSMTFQVTHLVIDNVRRLGEPVKARGQLGLWTVRADVEAKVRDALPA